MFEAPKKADVKALDVDAFLASTSNGGGGCEGLLVPGPVPRLAREIARGHLMQGKQPETSHAHA